MGESCVCRGCFAVVWNDLVIRECESMVFALAAFYEKSVIIFELYS